MKHRILCVLACVLAVPSLARAQQQTCPPDCTISVAALPFSATVLWDYDDDPAGISFQVVLDGTATGVAAPERTAPVTIGTAGPHSIAVRAVRTATGETRDTAPLSVTITVSAQAPPSAPTNLRLTWVPGSSTGAATTTSGADVMFAGHRWTINQMQTWRDGVWTAQGQATEYLVVASGLYCLGTDRFWYHWNEAAQLWDLSGSTRPTN